MAQLDRTQLKAKFENGDIPTQADFADLIDSLALKSEILNGDIDTSLITKYYTIFNEYKYLKFNSPDGRGVLGVYNPNVTDFDLTNRKNNYFQFDVRQGLNNSNSFTGFFYIGSDNTLYSSNSFQASQAFDFPTSADELFDNNDILFAFNNDYTRLADLFPMSVRGINPTLSFTHNNFTDNFSISSDRVFHQDNENYTIVARNFNHSLQLTSLFITLEYQPEANFDKNLETIIIWEHDDTDDIWKTDNFKIVVPISEYIGDSFSEIFTIGDYTCVNINIEMQGTIDNSIEINWSINESFNDFENDEYTHWLTDSNLDIGGYLNDLYNNM